ncbi:MAG TPA: hypothetical protein PLK08_05700, partial [Phycisphaerae bacterium]|nr:hypothetical protein [Phycisphaerae bacterium]
MGKTPVRRRSELQCRTGCDFDGAWAMAVRLWGLFAGWRCNNTYLRISGGRFGIFPACDVVLRFLFLAAVCMPAS